MPNEPFSLPALDALHDAATPGPWNVTGIELSSRDDPNPTIEQLEKNAQLIAALVNAWPHISARLKELEANPGLRAGVALESEAVAALRARVTELEAHIVTQAAIRGQRDAAEARVEELEGTNALLEHNLTGHHAREKEIGIKVGQAAARITILEQTLRGILQSRQQNLAQCHGEVVELKCRRDVLEKEIGWLESVLGGKL